MAFELFEADAPKTVAQFKALVAKGFYDGKDFYRVVRGHVIQAGGGDAPPLPPEFNTRPHLFGTLGLGRVGDEWSGDSEIYICVAPRPHLDGRYTVFGQLVEGPTSSSGSPPSRSRSAGRGRTTRWPCTSPSSRSSSSILIGE